VWPDSEDEEELAAPLLKPDKLDLDDDSSHDTLWEKIWEHQQEQDKEDEDSDWGNTAAEAAAKATARTMANDILASLGIPGSIKIGEAITQRAQQNETNQAFHVEPVAEEEKMEDEAWELELVRRPKLDPHAGNVLTPEKAEGTFRLWWGNLGYLSAWRNNADSEYFITQLAHHQVDIACVCEPNLQWHKVDTHNSWYERSTQVLGPQTF
jgi:hypothetical protein